MEILVTSDTHAMDAARLPAALLELAERADHIVHAGDHSSLDVHTVLEQFAPVTAVCGNVELPDVFDRLPSQVEVELDGVRLGAVHDGGPARGRHERLAARFPDCRVIVYGHSHMPELHLPGTGPWIINPGSPTQRRRAPTHTCAWLVVRGGEPARAELVDLDAT